MWLILLGILALWFAISASLRSLCGLPTGALQCQPHHIRRQGPSALEAKKRKSTSTSGNKKRKQAATELSSPQITNPNTNPDANYEDIFIKYGVGQSKDTRTNSIGQSKVELEQPSRFGQKALANMTGRMQRSADQVLAVGSTVSLIVVIASGVGISLSAMKIVFPGLELNAYVDSAATAVLSKAFTPSLGVFLLFSSTFGLLKLALINSDQTTYSE